MAKKKPEFRSLTDPELADQIGESLQGRRSAPEVQLTIGTPMSLDQVREELVILLASAREGARTADAKAKAYSSGRASALTEALELIGQALDVWAPPASAEEAKKRAPYGARYLLGDSNPCCRDENPVS